MNNEVSGSESEHERGNISSTNVKGAENTNPSAHENQEGDLQKVHGDNQVEPQQPQSQSQHRQSQSQSQYANSNNFHQSQGYNHQHAQFQAVPPSSLWQHQQQQQVHNNGQTYLPHSIPSMAPMVPVMPMNVNVDPLFQVQFYEARMRDHAAAFAQYANAAAGAALAAAHFATSLPGTPYPNNLQPQMSFYPNGTAMNGHQQQANNQQKIGDGGGENIRTGRGSQQDRNRNRNRNRNHPIDYQQNESNRRTRRRRDNNTNIIFRQHHNSDKKTKRNSVKSFDLMGKTGVSALHDLCNKRRWSQPKFTHVTSEETECRGQVSSCTSSTATAYVEFIMSVEVNGIDLSRGRGGSKKSAQQDAARKALSVLYPGCYFDANGILLDLGKEDMSPSIFVNSPSGQDKSNCLKDLEANMASRLSIDANNADGRQSPDPSEDSSISTTVSMARGKPAPVVTGGPFIKLKERARNRLAFPSASTTSGVSSASEDVDDDEYLASRGASVCSALLNVMVQIDKRIREQPTYTFDVCANPATIAQQQHQDRNTNQVGQTCSTKRKGVGFSGVGGAIVSKRRSATNAVGRIVTIHRSSFACTASLILHVENTKAAQNIPESNTLLKKKIEGEEIINDKPKSDEHDGKDERKNSDHSPDKISRKSSIESSDGIIIKRVEAVGTGASKREARHIASAKILALLFPDCNGMVEVKEAAEAAREEYAANRARLKRTAQSDGGKSAKRERLRKVNNEESTKQENITLLIPKSDDPPTPHWVSNRLSRCIEALDNAPTSDSMAKLSLSEPITYADDIKDVTTSVTKEIKRSNSCIHLSRQGQFETKIDAALQALHEKVDDKKPRRSYFKDSELSKTILRRATIEDIESIERLLSKGNETHIDKRAEIAQLSTLSSINPLSLVGVSSKSTSKGHDHDTDISTISSRLWGNQSVVLILSRAIAAQDEPPLGCAVLSLGFSLAKGRLLCVSEIRNEVHFPKERLVECLEELGNEMNSSIEVRDPKKDNDCGIFFSAKDLRFVVAEYAKTEDDNSDSTSANNSHIHRKPLQSVKEEDNEDEDAKSDQIHHKRAKLE